MLSIEDYISYRKKKDKLNEFDFQNHSENMSKVIKYVMEYFNQYLNIEEYSYEQVKMQQTIDKFKAGIIEKYPNTYEIIVTYYWDNRKRLDSYVEKAFKEMEDGQLFYLPDDYRKLAIYVCNKKLNVEPSEELLNQIALIAKDYRENQTSGPDLADMKELDNEISYWVVRVFQDYHVDLLDFAMGIASNYSDKYVDTEYDPSSETLYYINHYDYRYQENPFNIDSIYNRNNHREFINDHKGELEMLIMYYWLHFEIEDTDYWAEYVNLCIASQKVKLAKHKRILRPVTVNNIKYPSEIKSDINYVDSITGVLEDDPGEKYVLCITYDKKMDIIWKNNDAFEKIIQNLKLSFKKYGPPELLEFMSPTFELSFNEEEFLKKYQLFEKAFTRYKNMKIAVINGDEIKNKGKKYLISSLEDIERLRKACKAMKLKLKLSINFNDIKSKNAINNDMDNAVRVLASMRSFIVSIHINSISTKDYSFKVFDESKYQYINLMDYPKLTDFMGGLSKVFQDRQTRLLIPDKIKSSESLELLVDSLYRCGFNFIDEVFFDEQ